MSALDPFESGLDNFKRVADDSYIASCPNPGHGKGNGDRNPSLSIAHRDGKVLVHCQSGCHVQDVLLAMGLDYPDLFDEPITNERGHRVAEWVYQMPDGSIYYTVERWQTMKGKRFVQRVPGHDRPGFPSGFKPSLYRLPKVLAQAKAGGEVYIVEGEKCVHAAERLGLVATTGPNGANGWRDYYAKWLKGCSRVTIVIDNDEPGMTWGAGVAACLRGEGITVRTMRVAINDPKADLYDHVAAGLTEAQLIPVKLNRLRPDGITFSHLIQTDYPPVRWAIPGLLPAGLAILGGPPKARKSIVALNMALGVAHGGVALRYLRCNQGSVLYLSLDNDTERRLKSRAEFMAGDLLTRNLPIEFHTDFPVGDAALKACQEWVDDERDSGANPLLIVVDTLGKAEPNFEGESGGNAYLSSTSTLSKWSKLATDNNIAMLAIHHDRKGGDDDWLNRFTGSRGITATAQTLMMIEAKRGEPTGTLRIAGRDIDTDDLSLIRDGWGWAITPESYAEFDSQEQAPEFDGLRVIEGGQQ